MHNKIETDTSIRGAVGYDIHASQKFEVTIINVSNNPDICIWTRTSTKNLT